MYGDNPVITLRTNKTTKESYPILIKNGSFGAYRFFISDFQIPFKSEFTFDYGANQDVVSSVVYWYQRSPAIPIQKLIPWKERVGLLPIKESHTIDAPTGFIQYWNISKLERGQTKRPTLFNNDWKGAEKNISNINYYMTIKPSFGFISLGR